MANLQKFQAKACLTVAGVLIHQQKVLLVKHKKLGLWLPPGGHIELDELPHQAAEREFWEESSLKVQAVSIGKDLPSHDSEYLPHPFLTNLHWVAEENYKARVASSSPKEKHPSQKWPKGCEQHVCFVYMVKPLDPNQVNFKQNVEETDGISWFGLDELKDLETTEDVRAEIQVAFRLLQT